MRSTSSETVGRQRDTSVGDEETVLGLEAITAVGEDLDVGDKVAVLLRHDDIVDLRIIVAAGVRDEVALPLGEVRVADEEAP